VADQCSAVGVGHVGLGPGPAAEAVAEVIERELHISTEVVR
jgi:hypothetical protein